jgi:hypothetical protein
MTSFEPVYAALFAVSSGLASFVTSSRRVVPFMKMSAQQCPALFQGMGDEINETPRTRMPPRWRLTPKQYIYVDAGNDETVNPSTLINPILGALRDAFPQAALPGCRLQTLGGLIDPDNGGGHCFIERIETWEGTLGPREVAVVHFDILLTAVTYAELTIGGQEVTIGGQEAVVTFE